jgi:hypothetical protein
VLVQSEAQRSVFPNRGRRLCVWHTCELPALGACSLLVRTMIQSAETSRDSGRLGFPGTASMQFQAPHTCGALRSGLEWRDRLAAMVWVDRTGRSAKACCSAGLATTTASTADRRLSDGPWIITYGRALRVYPWTHAWLQAYPGSCRGNIR